MYGSDLENKSGNEIRIFHDWRSARNDKFFSRTTWSKRGIKLSQDIEPDGLLVESIAVSEVRIPWRPVLRVLENGWFECADSYFELFSENLVLEIDPAPSPNLENKFPVCSSFTAIKDLKETERRKGEGVHYDPTDQKNSPEVQSTTGTYNLNNLANTSLERTTKQTSRPSPAWTPRDFDFDQIQDTKIRDTVLRFVNLVYLKSNDYPDKNFFIPLKKKFLENHFGEEQIRKALEFCKLNGLIETDNQYNIGEKSIGYRIGSTYRNQSFKIRNVFLAPKENSKLKRLLRDSPHLRYLYNNLETLQIAPEAFSRLDPTSESWESAKLIPNGCFYFCQDEFSGRVHHNLTNMKKEVRAFLRVDGESLWEIDLKNSQPLFAGLAAAAKGFSDEGYLSLCQQGALYERLGALWGQSREDAKQTVLLIYFSKNGFHSKEKTSFEGEFPVFSKFMAQAKEVKHNHFAELAQVEERKLIIDTVLPKFIQKARGAFISTIHDSLLVQRKHVELVQGILTAEFLGRHGVVPSIHVKNTKDYLKK